MGQRKGALMINSAKSSGFCIPMVPGLSGCHVTGPGHFLADWGKLVSKHRWFRAGPAVRDNHGQHQLCLAKLAALFASSFASWCSHFLSRMSFCTHFRLFTRGAEEGGGSPPENGRGRYTASCSLNPAKTSGDQMQRSGKLIKTSPVFNLWPEQIYSSQGELF